MKLLLRVCTAGHALIAVLFAVTALLLLVTAIQAGWEAVAAGFSGDAATGLIETIGLIAVAVVALQMAQTIAEEEVIREAHISAPTRVRRFLSRFFVVVVVAIVIEGLVATFRAVHEDLAQLAYASSVLVAAGLLVAGWGVFVRLNAVAEQLEPEAMAQAKQEDQKLDH